MLFPTLALALISPLPEQKTIPYARRLYSDEYAIKLNKDQLEALSSTVYETHAFYMASWIHQLNEKVIFFPFHAFLACKGYYIQPRPGENKNVAAWQKSLEKVTAFGGCILTCIPALPSLVMGLAIRSLTHTWRPFLSYLKTPSAEISKPISLTKEEPLHIGAFNASLTPSSVNIEMDMRDPCTRAKEIAQNFIDDKQRPQILFFEETWNEDALKILCEGLKKVYPHCLSNICPNITGWSSGAAVFSLYPFKQVEFIRFGKMVPTHRLPTRGILKVTFDTVLGKPLHIYGALHTESMDGKDYCDSRTYQMNQLHQVMQEDAKNNSGCLQVAIGDCNISPYDLYGYDNRNQAEGANLKFIQQHFVNPFYHDHNEKGERIAGSAKFLSHDNARMNGGKGLPGLAEPTGTWSDGPFLGDEERISQEKFLEKDRLKYKFPPRVLMKTISEKAKSTWGTPDWHKEQSATGPTYDVVLIPRENNQLDGRVEIRRIPQKSPQQSASSDHLLLSFETWLKDI